MTCALRVGLSASAIVAVCSWSVPAHATVLTPGAGSTTVALDNGAPLGTLLASQSVPWTTPGAETGTFRSAVYRNSSGFLDFYYQVVVTTGLDAITRESNQDFITSPVIWTTDVFVRSDAFDGFTAGTVAPSSDNGFVIGRSPSGAVVGFNFDGNNNLVGGATSYVLVIKTNGTLFMPGNSSIQDGGSMNVATYSLASPVPEPTSLFLLGSGLVGLGASVRRRLRR